MEVDPRTPLSGVTEIDLHPDIESFANENGFTKAYRCTVQKWSDNYSKWALCRAYSNKTPTVDEIGTQYGIGHYRWIWATDQVDEVTQTRMPAKAIEQVIEGEHWENLHAEYAAEQEQASFERMRKILDKRKLRETIMGGGQSGSGSMLDMLREAKTLGLIGGSQDNGNNTLLFQMMQENSKNTNAILMGMMQMMGQAMGGNKGMTIQEIFTLMESQEKRTLQLTEKIMDMKNESEAPPETIWDKMMAGAATMLPQLLKMLSKLPTKEDRTEVATDLLKANPEGAELLETMKTTPGMLEKTIEVWDKEYGPEKVDILLESVNLKRPGV